MSEDKKWDWISVDDDLPEFVKRVDESIKNGVRWSSYAESVKCLVIVNGRVTDSVYVYWGDTGRCHWRMLGDKVTHWMHYPTISGSGLEGV